MTDDLDGVPPPDEFDVARRMRRHRAWLVQQVGSGHLALDGLFDEQDQDGRVGTVKIVVLAEQVPGVGKVRARRSMHALGIDEGARWGEVDRGRLRALWAAMADAATRPL